MSPGALARTARSRHIDILALTDHNASLNSLPFAVACAGLGIIPLFGIEMCSSEEVHLLALFPTPRDALAFGAALHPLLPSLAWDPGTFGDQVVVDDEERVLELHGRWLGAALDAAFGDLAEKARLAGALVIPAHVDRGMFSVYSQLGFLPPGPWDAVESMGVPPPSLSGGHTVVSGSDAHCPEHIGRRPFVVDMEEDEALEMKNALEVFSAALAAWHIAARAKTARATAAAGDAAARTAAAAGDTAAYAPPPPEAEAEFGGYSELLADPRLGLYPEDRAKRFFEALRAALRSGKVLAAHLPKPLV